MIRFSNNVIAQMTLACNKKCTYCYEHIGDTSPFNKQPMTFEVFKKYLDAFIYNRCVLGKLENTVDWHFHGGEVLLLPWPELRKMIAYLEERSKFFPGVTWLFQTNGTLITEEIAKFFKYKNKVLGFSFDGYGDNHRGSAEENEALMAHIKDLYEKTGADFAYLIVLSKKNKDTWLDDWNKNKEFCINFGINPLCAQPGSDEVLTPDELWECWLKPTLESFCTPNPIPERNTKFVLASLAADLLFNTTSKPSLGCFDRVCAHGSSMTALNVDGEISPCDKFLESGKFVENKVVRKLTDKDFLGAKDLRYIYRFYRDMFKEENKLGCDVCPCRSFCISDCQSHNLSTIGHVQLNKEMCSLNFKIYEFVKEHIVDILKNNPIKLFHSVKQLNGFSSFGKELATKLLSEGYRLIYNGETIYIEECNK